MKDQHQQVPAEVLFDSNNCDILAIDEKDTVPCKTSEAYLKYLEKKYGRKPPPDPPDPRDAVPDPAQP